MADYTTQIMSDTNKNTVIKFTGELDATGETANAKIIGRNLRGALATDSNNAVLVSKGGTPRTNYRYTIERITYDVNIPNGYLKVSWDGGTPCTCVLLSGSGDLDINDNMGSMINSATNPNGNVTFTTVNATNNTSYTVLFELRKNNLDYDAGQVAKPSDFNFGKYGIKP